MNVEEFIEKMRTIQKSVVDFLDCEENIEEKYQNLMKLFQDQDVESDSHKLKLILYLLSKLSKYHRRSANFFQKIERILLNYKNKIKNFFSNSEIFKIFKGNKRILLFLIEENIVNIDDDILAAMNSSKYKNANYPEYFYTNIQQYLKEKNSKELKIGENDEKPDFLKDLKKHDENRKIGENENILCQLIRQDLIDEFITYVNKEDLPLQINIDHSIYETNTVLLRKKEITLIEYASFFGSIQIFKYLYKNFVKFTSELWILAIHGDDEEMIHTLEENNILPPKISYNFYFSTTPKKYDPYMTCFKEAIKCHHNHIVSYIQSNLSTENIEYINYIDNYEENILSYSFHYFNFAYLPTKIKSPCIFFYACEYDYFDLVSLLLQKERIDINSEIKIFIYLFYTSALNKAARKNNQEIINLLLSQKDILIIRDCFLNCKKLTKIVIPSFITSIEPNAFKYCSLLQQIIIPSSVTIIKEFAFCRCSSLKQIVIPSSVTTISSNAFNGCFSLIDISISSSITEISEGLFYNCSSLQQITIPPVNSIENEAFYGCSSLKTIVFEKSSRLVFIGESAFSGCSSLGEITIPSSVNSIGKYAFKGCFIHITFAHHFSFNSFNRAFYGIISLKMSGNIKHINQNFFYGCSSLEEVSIPSSTTSIEARAFCECSSLNCVLFESPSSLISIKNDAFSKCLSLVLIKIPSSVSSIQKYAFYACSSLKQIIIPSLVTKIEDNCFEECSSLTQITIPSSVTSIGSYAFKGCSSLEEINIPSSVTVIGNNAFSGCSLLKEINIPSSVTIINDNTFSGMVSLKEITIPSSIKSIGNLAFFNCTSLKQVTIPSSVISIGEGAFGDCKSLVNVEIPSSITSINKNTFRNCESLVQVSISSSVKTIGSFAFFQCSSLINVDFEVPSSLISIGEGVFGNCTSLPKISIPPSVTLIDKNTFRDCSSLKEITFPSSIKKIKSFAFKGCTSLKKVQIPSFVINIASSAFPPETKLL